MGKTSIQWATDVWNPITGCTKVSAGCKHCYAERVFPRAYAGQMVIAESSKRFCDDGNPDKIVRPRRFTDVMTHTDRLDQPLRWRKPRRVFVNSMSDLFHDDVPDAFIALVWSRMAIAQQHTFQILTKRPERMRALIADPAWQKLVEIAFSVLRWKHHGPEAMWPLPNVWLGVSVEDQVTADQRIPLLLETPAAIRFVSYEPALGPVDFTAIVNRSIEPEPGTYNALSDEWWPALGDADAEYDGRIRGMLGARLDWIIVGGESGPKARPFDVQWARDTIYQCRDAGVPVFVKQLGANPWFDLSDEYAAHRCELDHRAGADMAEWPADLRVQEWPGVA